MQPSSELPHEQKIAAPATPTPNKRCSAGRRARPSWPARAAPVGLARPEQVAGQTGLQMFEAMLAGELPRPPITTTLEFWLVEAALGHAVFQGTPAFEHYNPLGGVHGGWIATLLDSARRLRGAHAAAAGQGLHDAGAEGEFRQG